MFQCPAGVAFNHADKTLFVSDSEVHRVQVRRPQTLLCLRLREGASAGAERCSDDERGGATVTSGGAQL